MTVLFLTRRFYPQFGGVETHVLKVSEDLIRHGFKVIIIADALDNKRDSTFTQNLPISQNRYIDAKLAVLNDKLDKSTYSIIRGKAGEYVTTFNPINKNKLRINNNIILYRLPFVKEGRLKKIFIWYWFWRNRFLIANTDLVHCHDVFYWYLPFRFLYPKKKVYTTFHGYEQYPIPLKNILIRKISEKLSNGNICIGKFINKWYGTKENYISYGGIDKVSGKSTLFDRSAIFFGRLDEQTGIKLYNEAFTQLKQVYPDFRFSIYGEGKMKGVLSKQTNYYKPINHEQLINEISKYRFAFVSRYLAILEAMAARRLVIAVYDNPLKEDYLRLTPFHKWIIIVNNSQDMINNIEHLLSYPQEEAKLIDQAYLWVKKQTWLKVSETYQNLWKIK